ncbi:MAG: site-specific integrase [Actinomycetota bacterium]|nr:site-specific integrase [Actinomycetota bacterium]
MSDGKAGAGRAGVHLVEGLSLLRPEEQVFAAMLDGWRSQQLARNLALSTIEGRVRVVQAFVRHCDELPWRWTPGQVDDWCADLRAVSHRQRSTLRSYQEAVRTFCSYLTDPGYGWSEQCEQRFGTHPVQVVHEWNTAVHVQAAESDPGRRAFTVTELDAFFDHADAQVRQVRTAGRKGWLSAFRDATLFKVAFAYGLRRNEVRMLETVDFGRNPRGEEFGDYGVVHVRHGKAMKGSPPKRRSVLTVWDWTPEVVQQWITEIRSAFHHSQPGNGLWPSERTARVSASQLNSRFALYRDQLDLDPALGFHSLRRSYVTHLIEDGFDPFFVQQQVGHEHASTTSIYTCVSSDFRTRTLRRVLDDTLTAATTKERGPR